MTQGDGMAEVKSTGLPERIANQISTDSASGCWIWSGYQIQGYGRVRYAGRRVATHRLVYETLRGSIPDGLELDHLCRVTSCCNPEHLEPVTHRENVLRGASPMADQARRTHCPEDHAYDGNNLYVGADGSRSCRECGRLRRALKTGAQDSGKRKSDWLTEEQREGIVAMRQRGVVYREIAEAYGISLPHAARVANGKKTGRAA